MTEGLSFDEQVELLKQKVINLDEQSNETLIEETAVRLEKLGYTPPVIIPLGTFLRLDKESLLKEIERILEMPDHEACALAPDEPKKCQDLRLQFISVQIYYFEKLMLLRQGDSETWDEINEFYVHD